MRRREWSLRRLPRRRLIWPLPGTMTSAHWRRRPSIGFVCSVPSRPEQQLSVQQKKKAGVSPAFFYSVTSLTLVDGPGIGRKNTHQFLIHRPLERDYDFRQFGNPAPFPAIEFRLATIARA